MILAFLGLEKNANNLGDKFKGKSETPMSKNIRLIGVPAHSP